MRLYEVVYILDPALDEGAVTTKLDKFHQLATAQGGEVSSVDHWGSRQLAYPVNNLNHGYYVVAQFTAAPDALPEFERIVRLDGEVMRYLLVINEGEPSTGHSIMAESHRPPSEDDEDDEDGDDDEDDGQSPPEFQGGGGRRRRMEGPAIALLNYKDVSTLSRFLTEQGKILPKRTTKVTSRFQRQLGRAVKRARYLALIPYTRSNEG
jgi:small subunit ribosomal protein S6